MSMKMLQGKRGLSAGSGNRNDMRGGFRGSAWGLTSYVPTLAAIAIVLGFGLVADQKTRDLARSTEREEAAQYLDGVKLRTEEVVGGLSETLARLTGEMSAEAGAVDKMLEAKARLVTDDSTAVMGLAFLPRDDGRMLAIGRVPNPDQVSKLLRRSDPAVSGARNIPGATPQALALWSPVLRKGETRPDSVWGQAAIVVDSERIFVDAGLRNESSAYEIALTEKVGAVSGGLRAMLLGSADVIAGNPVSTDIRMPGGDWRLEVIPRGGWTAAQAEMLPIRGLTLLSIAIIAWLFLRVRHMSEERQSNVAALQQKECELSETSERLDLALALGRIGVFDYNATTDTLVWDARMREHYDAGADTGAPLSYRHWAERLHPEDRAATEKKVRIALETGEHFLARFRIRDRQGRVRHIEASAACLTDADGSRRMIGLNWDVTATVERTQELERRQNQIQEAADTRARFFATMSHEIRTPLNGILGILELMRHGTLGPEQRERVNLLHNSARQLINIVNDCLDLSKLHAAQMSFHPERMDAREMAREVVSLLSATSHGDGVAFSVTASDSVPDRIVCDPMRLRQVLTNLVGNAIKYTDSGSVELRLDYGPERGGTLRVAVVDTGIGIPEAALATLFKSYVQVGDRGVRERGGTGLGLAICKEIVTTMGGEISVESEPGAGTTFRFRIPATAAPSDADERPPEPSGIVFDRRHLPAPGAAAVAPCAARVLVAAAPDDTRRAISAYLDIGGHDCSYAATGAEVIETARAGRHDLIILDLDMALLDAYATARRIRSLDPPASDVPILLLSAIDSRETEEKCRISGASEILVKPVTVDCLYDAIERALGMAVSRSASADLMLRRATGTDRAARQ